MACHDLSGRRQPADFEWFDYVEHDTPADYPANRERLKGIS